MPVSGLVVSLSDEPQRRAEALAVIGREARITMGVLEANRLAIVLDTASSEEDRQLWDWLGSLLGVSFVEVAFVGFEQRGAVLPVQGGQMPTATRCNSAVVSKDGSQDGC
jgi:hypothetical protein